MLLHAVKTTFQKSADTSSCIYTHTPAYRIVKTLAAKKLWQITAIAKFFANFHNFYRIANGFSQLSVAHRC